MAINCLGVIPARYASQRRPGKPLADLAGKPLIQWVWEQAKQAQYVSELVIATEDQRIYDCAQDFGANVMMTSELHLTGSDRVSEVAERYAADGRPFDMIANIQGDMPFINPHVIDAAIKTLSESPSSVGMATIATPILEETEFLKPSAVKVVLGTSNEALYFSRASIPFIRSPEKHQISESVPYGYKHMGLYIFRADTLKRMSSLEPSLPELREQLEQLRALCNGIPIRVYVAPRHEVEPCIEVDTPEDIDAAIRHIKGRDLRQ